MKNVLHVSQTIPVTTIQSAWSDDRYELIPFDCDCRLDKDQLWQRLAHAICKRFPPRHFGGCGYSCSIVRVLRDCPDNGYVLVMHYHGIGD